MNTHTSQQKSLLGVSLGGGGSRAFIHLGVLAQLEAAGLPPARLTGSSMGAVLGSLYAAHPDASTTIPKILSYFRKSSLLGSKTRQSKSDGLHRRPGLAGRLAKKLATLSVASIVSLRHGLRRVHPVNRAIDDLFADIPAVDGLAIPFGLNTINLTTGQVEDIVAGPLAPALKAGVAIGMIFAPYRWNDCQYADAAPVCPVPVGLCRRLGADTVLAVDICSPLEKCFVADTGFDVVRRLMAVQSDTLNRQETAGADVTLKIDASDVFWGDFSRLDELVERGRTAAERILPELRAKLGEE